MKTTTLFLFGIATITTFAVAFSPAAFALERKQSAFSCFAALEDRDEMDVDLTTSGVRNRSSGLKWQERKLYCPVQIDDAFPVNSASLEINGRDGDSGATVWAQACLSWRWANGGFCGATVANGAPSTVGWYNLSFTPTTMGDPLYYWRNSPWDYPYVVISLPGQDGANSAGFPSAVTGFRIYN